MTWGPDPVPVFLRHELTVRVYDAEITCGNTDFYTKSRAGVGGGDSRTPCPPRPPPVLVDVSVVSKSVFSFANQGKLTVPLQGGDENEKK